MQLPQPAIDLLPLYKGQHPGDAATGTCYRALVQGRCRVKIRDGICTAHGHVYLIFLSDHHMIGVLIFHL